MKDLLRKLIITLVLSTAFAGLAPAPARAQFGGIVHDPITLAAHIRQWAEQLQEWIKTVDFYARQIEHMVETVTNLKGILRTAEEAIGFNKKMLQTISDIGRTVRAAFQIKAYLTDLVQGRMRAIARIHDRLANGLFDPDRLKQDLRDYFFFEIGQISERTANHIEYREQLDQQLQLMEVELQLQAKRIAEAERSAQASDQKLRQIESNPEGVTQVDIQLLQLRQQQRDYEVSLARDRENYLRLQREVLMRKQHIAEGVIDSQGFGQQITDMNSAWTKMTDALNRMRDQSQQQSPPSN